jgi:hypothetical protein
VTLLFDCTAPDAPHHTCPNPARRPSGVTAADSASASLLFFVAAVVQFFIANPSFAEMIDLVNQRLPLDGQIPPVGANTRSFEIRRMYQTFYPEGNLRRKQNRLSVCDFLCLGAAIAMLLLGR